MCPFSFHHSPRFHKPPYHPGRSVFPNPVGSHSLSPHSLPDVAEAQVLAHIHPQHTQFAARLDLSTVDPCSPALQVRQGVLLYPPCYPEPLRLVEALPRRGSRIPPPRPALPSPPRYYGLRRQTNPLPPPLVVPPSVGLRRLLRAPAGNWSFPTFTLRIFLCVPGPLPRLLLWCTYPFLPTRHRPSQR
jgi:hypothetical protein